MSSHCSLTDYIIVALLHLIRSEFILLFAFFRHYMQNNLGWFYFTHRLSFQNITQTLFACLDLRNNLSFVRLWPEIKWRIFLKLRKFCVYNCRTQWQSWWPQCLMTYFIQWSTTIVFISGFIFIITTLEIISAAFSRGVIVSQIVREYSKMLIF